MPAKSEDLHGSTRQMRDRAADCRCHQRPQFSGSEPADALCAGHGAQDRKAENASQTRWRSRHLRKRQFRPAALETLLRYLGAQRLVITGIAGNYCVLFTANDAYMRDYELVVPSDCTA